MPQTAPVMSLSVSVIVLQLIMSTASLIYFSNQITTIYSAAVNMNPENTYWLW
nr:TPA_asm: ATP8 [Gammarus fossarum]DAZ91253.1 TPA_asm: ATP8 [Gammarus fossarum]